VTGVRWLASYPKSGNTWVRFLIANLVRPNETIDFSNVNGVIPGPEVTRNRDLMRIPRPRIIKSHQYFDPRYKQVIYIVRDPRDVVVSQYHFQRKRKIVADGFPLSDFVSRFLAGETCFYGSWGEHVSSWLATRTGISIGIGLPNKDGIAVNWKKARSSRTSVRVGSLWESTS